MPTATNGITATAQCAHHLPGKERTQPGRREVTQLAHNGTAVVIAFCADAAANDMCMSSGYGRFL